MGMKHQWFERYKMAKWTCMNKNAEAFFFSLDINLFTSSRSRWVSSFCRAGLQCFLFLCAGITNADRMPYGPYLSRETTA